MFERAVKHYVKCSSNCKNLEYTFARAESRREFLKFYMSASTLVSSPPEIDNRDLVRNVYYSRASDAQHSLLQILILF